MHNTDIFLNMIILNILIEHLVLYWGVSLILLKYKGCKFDISYKTASVVLFNQCVVEYLVLKFFPILPSKLTNELYMDFINYAILYYYLQCIWFYFSHRILHQRFFWKHIHYIHHKYKSTMPYAAIYCHPLEHLFVNLMSVFIGPILFPSSIILTKMWFHICTVNTVIQHFSHLRGNNRSTHDLHHLLYRYNYGTGTTMDIIFGTYMKP